MLHIYIDADACPVKNEVYRVASREGLEVTLVANSTMRIPDDPSITLEVVGDAFDAADDWIVQAVDFDDIVITAGGYENLTAAVPKSAEEVERARENRLSGWRATMRNSQRAAIATWVSAECANWALPAPSRACCWG